jgi:laminin alpha 1/2
MGDNRTVSVSESFASPYQLCDNRWHSVKANYVENALTLKVDHQDEQYGFSSNGHVKEAKTRNPLFIGGLPGTSNPIDFYFLILFQIEI